MVYRSVFSAGIVALAGGVAQAAWVPLGLASDLNVDIVATQNEIAAHPSGLAAALGDHNVHTNRAYLDNASAGAGTGLPNNGIIGNFQTATTFDSGSPYATKSNNAVLVAASNSTATKTITLSGAEQDNYKELDLLFVALRGSGATYRTTISATYTDATSAVLFDTGDVTAGNTTAGGTIGSAGVNNAGGLRFNDTHSDVAIASQSSRLYGGTAVATASAYLWHLSTPLTVDQTRVLESVTFTVKAVGSNRTNNLYILGVSANTVPEPTAMALIGIGLACFTARRVRP